MLDPLQFYCRVLCNGMKTRFRMVMIAHPGRGIGLHKRFMWRIIIPPTPAGSPLPKWHIFSLCKFFPLFWVTPGGLQGLGLKGGAVPPGVHPAIPPSPLMFPSTIMGTHTHNLPCMCNWGYIPTRGYVLTTRRLEGCLLDVVSMRGWVIG